MYVLLHGRVGNAFANQVTDAMHSLVSQNPYDISNDRFPGVHWAFGACVLTSMSMILDKVGVQILLWHFRNVGLMLEFRLH